MNAAAWRRLMLLAAEHDPALGADLRRALAAWHADGADAKRLAYHLGLAGNRAVHARGASLRRAVELIRARRPLSDSAASEEVAAYLRHSESAGAFKRFIKDGAAPPAGGIGAEIFDALASGAPKVRSGRRVRDAWTI